MRKTKHSDKGNGIKISFFCNLFFVLFSCCGCCDLFTGVPQEPTIYRNGYFEYSFCREFSRFADQDDDSIAIVGLTETGYMQETLDIPQEIDGYTVSKLGVELDGAFNGSSYAIFYGSDNLKKIFIFHNIEFANFDLRNVDLMVCSNDVFDYIPNHSEYIKNVFFDHCFFEQNEFLPNSCSKEANVTFLLNLPSSNTRDIYRIDNVNIENEIIEPTPPVTENYKFTGWYTEPECKNVWDFSDKLELEQIEFIDLYAGWSNL